MSIPGEIGTFVRNWMHYNNLASSFYKQYCEAKQIGGDFEKKIITTLETNKIPNAIIQIGGGQLSVNQKRNAQPLSLVKIESLLNHYYQQKGGKNEVADIMAFITANRDYSTVKYIKQHNVQKLQGGQLKTPK